MTKKSPRFVQDFIGEYIGETQEQFAENFPILWAKAMEFKLMCDSDIDFVSKLLEERDCREARCAFIRTLPAYIEGHLNILRLIPHLYLPLRDRIPEKYTVEFWEPMIEIRNRSTTKDSIKNTLIGIGHVAGVEVSSKIMGEPGAQALMATFGLRDSLMHPRSIEGISVTDKQLSDAWAGNVWFLEKFQIVFNSLKGVVYELIQGY